MYLHFLDLKLYRLTVEEHLKLVCELKCVPKDQVDMEIMNTLRLVMLEIHRYKEVR